MNNLETITFANKTSLTLNGAGGDDTFNVTPTNITLSGVSPMINVDGAAGANDVITVNGAAGGNPIGYKPTGPGSATVTVGGAPQLNLANLSSAAIDGQANDNQLAITTPVGVDDVTYTPGGAIDSGSIEVGSLLPLSFSNLGTAAGIALADTSTTRVDNLTFNGTAAKIRSPLMREPASST